MRIESGGNLSQLSREIIDRDNGNIADQANTLPFATRLGEHGNDSCRDRLIYVVSRVMIIAKTGKKEISLLQQTTVHLNPGRDYIYGLRNWVGQADQPIYQAKQCTT